MYTIYRPFLGCLAAALGLLACDSAPGEGTEADTTQVADSTSSDAATDSAVGSDTTVADSAVGSDTTVADTTVADTTVADTTVADTTVADTTVADTAVADTAVADTAVADTGQTCVPSDDTVCVADTPNKVFKADSCGNPTTPKTTCSSTLSCEVHSVDGQAYCACPLTGENTCKVPGGLSNLYDLTQIELERSCASANADPADLVEVCGFGSVCFHEDAFNDGEPLCHRSIHESQSDKPYYNHGCGQFSEWLRHPTKLEIDCRCRYVSDGTGVAGGTAGNSTGNGYADPNNPDPANGGYPAGPIINCATAGKMLSKEWPVEYGSGPSFYAWYEQSASGASWYSGDVNPTTREMYGLIRWTNANYVGSGTVVAWHLDTGDRRIISGLHPDPQFGQKAYGSGYMSPKFGNTGTVTEQPLTGANTLRYADDGMLYIYGGGTGEGTSAHREIVKVDPTTGVRTLIWLAQNSDTGDVTDTYGQCLRPNALDTLDQSVRLYAQAFEVAPDGSFYLSFRGNREGDGIVKVSADGSTCSFVSRWGGLGHAPGGGIESDPAPAQIGDGFILQFPVRGLLHHEGLLYGVSNDDLYSFDPGTGQRVKWSYTDGAYRGMGYANMFWDPTREVIWAVGTIAAYVGSIVDLDTGRRESVYGDSGRQEYGDQAILNSVYAGARSVDGTMLSNGHSIGYGAVVLDPADNNIVYAVLKLGALMKLELSTFNNYVHSW